MREWWHLYYLSFTMRVTSRPCVLVSLIYRSNSKFDETVQINYHYKGKMGVVVIKVIKVWNLTTVTGYTWMVDAIHREASRTFQWTSLLWSWPIKHLQFPTLTALTPATVMSCYHDNLPYSNITVIVKGPSSSLIMDMKKVQLCLAAAAKYP